MLLLFLSLFRQTTSQIQNICVCHANECENKCQKTNIEGKFKIILDNEFENSIVNEYYSSQKLFRKFRVFVTFDDQPVQFNLSSFNYLQISFFKYFNFDESSKISVKIKNDINFSYAQLAFSQSNVVVSQSNILNLGSLKILDESTLNFANHNDSNILITKCCNLNNFSFMIFDEIHVENGFCSEDFYLESDSIHTIQFGYYNYSKINYYMTINNKVKVFNALEIKLKSNDNINLIVSSHSQNSQQDLLKIIPQISLCNFGQIYFENDIILESLEFTIKNAKSIFCKTKHLSANFDNIDLYIENDIFINGTVNNISVFSNRAFNNKRILLTIERFLNHLNIKSSFIDININQFVILNQDPITFCVGKGGISKVTIQSTKLKSDLLMISAFQNLCLNRDFQNYLSDSDITPFLYKYTKYLEIPYFGSYAQDQQTEVDININFTESSNIHGFTNFDSILTAIEISSNPKIFAVYFDSPNKKLLNICLSSEISSKPNDKCFLMNSFTNDILKLNSGVKNVLIDIKKDFEYEQLNFESFFTPNLTITANHDHFGILNFIGNVTSNLTINNLYNFSLKITPTYQANKPINIKNICIYNSSIYELISDGTEKIQIDNFSITEFLDFPSKWEIKNLNYLSNYTDIAYIVASANKEILYVSNFGFVHYTNYENFNVYFSFYVDQSKERSSIEKNLHIFLNTDQAPSFNVYVNDDNASITFSKWENIPSLFDDYYSEIQNQVSIISSSNQISINENKNFTVFHSVFNINILYSMELKKVNFVGSGFVSNSLLFNKIQTYDVDSTQANQYLEFEVNKMLFEEVFIEFNKVETNQITKSELSIASMRNKIVHFNNHGQTNHKVYVLEKIDLKDSLITPSYHIIASKIQLYMKKQELISISELLDESNDDYVCQFRSIFFDELTLLDGASLKGFDAVETTFRRLKCTFNDINSLGNKIMIKEKLSLYGEINNENIKSEKIINFSSNSFLELTLNNRQLKILIGERIIKIGPFSFDGVENAEITINVQKSDSFDYIIESIEKEKLNFSLFPKVSIIQKENNANQFSKLLDNEEKETYKFINIKNIRKGIKEKVANKFAKNLNLSKHTEKVVKNTQNPSELQNSIHLMGNWKGCDSRFSFYNLSNVNFISDSATVPFHFISTKGDINIYVNNKKTDFLGNFFCSSTKNPIQVNVLSKNIFNTISNVTFCGTFGGFSEIHLRLSQPRLHVCFNKLFFYQNLLNIHLFMSVDGYSMFSILEGGSFVDRIIHLNFKCDLELTDQKITQFLKEKEKVLGLYVDPTFSNRIITGWDVIPETHGLLESFEFYFSKRARKLIYLMKQSPFDIPLSVCISELDTCEVSIPSDEHFNDIRPFLPKGKKSILFLLSDSPNSILNFDYPFFDDFTIYLVGYGIIDVNVKFGKHISELDLSSVNINIYDKDNYSIDTVYASDSIITNINGIQRLEFVSFDNFKSNKIDSFTNKIIVPSDHDRIVFQKNGIQLEKQDYISSTYQIKLSNFPDLEIKIIDPRLVLGAPNTDNILEFLIEDDVNVNNINKFSIIFDTETEIHIGKGWEKIHKKSVFNRVEGLSNINQITTESFPFQPLSMLTNQEVSNKLIPVYPNDDLFPISITSEISLLENEMIVLDLSDINDDDDDDDDDSKKDISFEGVIMNDKTKIQILNDQIQEYDDTEKISDNNYIEIDQLVVSKDSSCSISSALINDKIEMKENSNFFGNLIFEKNSTLVINGEYNTNTKEFINFPSIIFDSYPTSVPSKILININEVTKESYANNNIIINFYRENEKFRETKTKMKILSSLEQNSGVFISNLGFLCSDWNDIVKISSNISVLISSCVNGFLTVSKTKNDEITIITPQTPYQINLSDYARPTMTPIVFNRNNQIKKGISKEFFGVIIISSFFVILMIVLFVVIFNLKKKYSKFNNQNTQDEDENNNSLNNNNIQFTDDSIKL